MLPEIQPTDQGWQGWQKVYFYPSKGQMYYCYMWGCGHSVFGKVHISGGAVGTPVADGRAATVKEAIKYGASIDEVLTIIRGMSNAKPGHKSKS